MPPMEGVTTTDDCAAARGGLSGVSDSHRRRWPALRPCRAWIRAAVTGEWVVGVRTPPLAVRSERQRQVDFPSYFMPPTNTSFTFPPNPPALMAPRPLLPGSRCDRVFSPSSPPLPAGRGTAPGNRTKGTRGQENSAPLVHRLKGKDEAREFARHQVDSHKGRSRGCQAGAEDADGTPWKRNGASGWASVSHLAQGCA